MYIFEIFIFEIMFSVQRLLLLNSLDHLLLSNIKIFTNVVVSCPGVRYARIDAGANYLQISQLAVYDTSGSNVALGMTTTASSVYTKDTCTYYASGAVDGVLVAKYFKTCTYKSYLSSSSSGAYWLVDLGSSQTISSVVYYNRADTGDNVRAATYTLSLLDAANGLVCSCSTFTTSLIQTLSLILGRIRIMMNRNILMNLTPGPITIMLYYL